MTGYDLKRLYESLKQQGRARTKQEFAELLGYSHYQRILELEKRGHKRIGNIVEIRIRAARLEK